MAFSPQPSNEDVLFQSDQSPQYNNGVAQDETMCYESEEEHFSGDELQVGDQDVDYTQLERSSPGQIGGAEAECRHREAEPHSRRASAHSMGDGDQSMVCGSSPHHRGSSQEGQRHK
jgi:hypothetical protein